MGLKPHHSLSSLFHKPKDVINFDQNRGLFYQFFFGNSNTVLDKGFYGSEASIHEGLPTIEVFDKDLLFCSILEITLISKG